MGHALPGYQIVLLGDAGEDSDEGEDRLSPYKRICRIEFGPLPKTISGKIRRVDLRATEGALASAGERAAAEYRWDDFADPLRLE